MTPDIDYLARLRAEIERPPYHAVLRPQPVAVEADTGTVVIKLAYRPEFARAPDEPAVELERPAICAGTTRHALIMDFATTTRRRTCN